MKPAGERYAVAVDFDGVLHSYTTPWAGATVIPDPPVEGAIEWLNETVEKLDVVVFTTRGHQDGGPAAVMRWLREHGYVGPDLLVTGTKVPALAYIDDRALRFEGPGTFPTVERIHQARPWNKRGRT